MFFFFDVSGRSQRITVRISGLKIKFIIVREVTGESTRANKDIQKDVYIIKAKERSKIGVGVAGRELMSNAAEGGNGIRR